MSIRSGVMAYWQLTQLPRRAHLDSTVTSVKIKTKKTFKIWWLKISFYKFHTQWMTKLNQSITTHRLNFTKNKPPNVESILVHTCLHVPWTIWCQKCNSSATGVDFSSHCLLSVVIGFHIFQSHLLTGKCAKLFSSPY